jgi:hypothetical protein
MLKYGLSCRNNEVEGMCPMHAGRNSIGREELEGTEAEIIASYNEAYRPHAYSRVFYAPPHGDWKVDALFVEGFFSSAKLLLQQLIDGKLLEAEHVAAVFLCRHYLELAIKYTLFHSRWLRDERTNATNEEIAAVETDHSLYSLWGTLRGELRARLPGISKVGFDLDFVEKLVAEFQQVDKGGCRFRYPAKEFAVAPAVQPSTLCEPLGIDFPALLFALEHTQRVLGDLDAYLVNTHGLNEEWEAELYSL